MKGFCNALREDSLKYLFCLHRSKKERVWTTLLSSSFLPTLPCSFSQTQSISVFVPWFVGVCYSILHTHTQLSPAVSEWDCQWDNTVMHVFLKTVGQVILQVILFEAFTLSSLFQVCLHKREKLSISYHRISRVDRHFSKLPSSTPPAESRVKNLIFIFVQKEASDYFFIPLSILACSQVICNKMNVFTLRKLNVILS